MPVACRPWTTTTPRWSSPSTRPAPRRPHGDVPVGAVVVAADGEHRRPPPQRAGAARRPHRPRRGAGPAGRGRRPRRPAPQRGHPRGHARALPDVRRARRGRPRWRRVVFGAADLKAGATGSLYNVAVDQRLNHTSRSSGPACGPRSAPPCSPASSPPEAPSRFRDPPDYPSRRRVARADEWDGLENRCGFRVTVGSNPTPSASQPHGEPGVPDRCARSGAPARRRSAEAGAAPATDRAWDAAPRGSRCLRPARSGSPRRGS